MRTYTCDKVPSYMFTKSKMRKMGLVPVSEHSAFVLFPPNRRKYKLYSLENARPINSQAGYSVIRETEAILSSTDTEISKKFEEIRNRFKQNNVFG
ncbi:hypothetical protein A8L34_16755 [Bacillus sp. FJAT-27264]|uniref:hypothetical protein n=1 Tax=Paenibacillus sp. (strain DSM 101736 / FJAT-27264) TaxID=1850362 RepID=UPI000808022D|nr:hypothetical protein [Bacillus sp. FJAT-27264]OBZ11965.1 hypothetical protein A8L34_16755 [Bacillus sp. FJAT-27264]